MTAASAYIGGASSIQPNPTQGLSGHLTDHSYIYSTLSIFENLFNAGGGSGGGSGNASALGGVTASNYVTLTGTQTLTNKTLTGPTILIGPTYATPPSSNNNYFYVSGSVGAVKGYMINSTTTVGGSGSIRWGIYADGTAETSASSGSDFSIARYDNNGNNIGQQISISRSTGLVTMPSANLLSASLNGVPLTTGGGTALTVQNAGTVVTSTASVLNFTGGGATISNAGGSVNINIALSGTASNTASLGGFPASYYAPAASPTFSSATFLGGNVNRAPIIINAGSSLNVPIAGALEYDGYSMLFTTNTSASSRGMIPTTFYVTNSVSQTLASSSAAQPIFGATSSVVNLAANTAYELELYFSASHGSSSSLTFPWLIFNGGTAGIASIGYNVMANGQENSFTYVSAQYAVTQNRSSFWTSTAPAQILNPINASGNYFCSIAVKGILRTSTAGTFIPQFAWGAGSIQIALGITSTIMQNSYMKIIPLGSDTFISNVSWHA